jgi:hypothetical protein
MAYAPTAGWSKVKRSTDERNGVLGGLEGVGCDIFFSFSFFPSFFPFLCWVSVFAGELQKWGASLQIVVAFVAEGAGIVTKGVVLGGGFPMRRRAGRGYSGSTVYEGDSRCSCAQIDATLGVPSGLP